MTLIIYGSTTGNTESAAGKIAAALGDARAVSAADISPDEILASDRIILGTSTWGAGDLQDDWEDKISILDGLDLSGKKGAVFGLGDQEGYPDTFVDAMKILRDKLKACGAELTGEWSTEGYEFDESQSAEGEMFAGLVLDEDNQSDLSDDRIDRWVQSLK